MNKVKKVLLYPFRMIGGIFSRVFLWRMRRALSKSIKVQCEKRVVLRKEINLFLKEYFGLNGRSEFIPADFKNTEEVRIATIEKFGLRMSALSLNYTDLFK